MSNGYHEFCSNEAPPTSKKKKLGTGGKFCDVSFMNFTDW